MTNIVLVQRSGDKVGGSIQANWGVKVTDTYTKTGETTYKVTVDVQLVTNLPEYKDPGPHLQQQRPFKKLEQKVARAQELMDSSMTRQELDVAIGTVQGDRPAGDEHGRSPSWTWRRSRASWVTATCTPSSTAR